VILSERGGYVFSFYSLGKPGWFIVPVSPPPLNFPSAPFCIMRNPIRDFDVTRSPSVSPGASPSLFFDLPADPYSFMLRKNGARNPRGRPHSGRFPSLPMFAVVLLWRCPGIFRSQHRPPVNDPPASMGHPFLPPFR